MVSRLQPPNAGQCALKQSVYAFSKSEPVTGRTTSERLGWKALEYIGLNALDSLLWTECLSVWRWTPQTVRGEPFAFRRACTLGQKRKNQVVLKPKTISALFSGQSASAGRAVVRLPELETGCCPEKRWRLRLPNRKRSATIGICRPLLHVRSRVDRLPLLRAASTVRSAYGCYTRC